jgi:hypothetical protein
MIALSQPVQLAQAEPCKMTLVRNTRTRYYDEINNCKLLQGTFYNEDWKVELSQWEPGLYVYRGTNRITGDKIELMSSQVAGTVDRPQYRLKNGEVIYSVSFQRSDPSTIRVEIFENGTRIFNQLLNR